MITYIHGQLINFNSDERTDSVEILTSSGVGYQVFIPKNFSIPTEKNSPITLYTSMQVREDSQTLYGFLSREDRDFFNLLITVSGIGPKIGMAIVSRFTTKEVCNLIMREDFKMLATVSGLGSKGAQKIILELKNKIDGFNMGETSDVIDNKGIINELKQALKALGFDHNHIEECAKEAEKQLKEKPYNLEELIKLVLSSK
ncbi:MAG TPA: Holliday junction branch migration protein RuvA [Candidatus Dojkabacteria bacterium]|nr:Holliday junction branch migration protein RuvA [Candidatus Dojkabacteria bacterium]